MYKKFHTNNELVDYLAEKYKLDHSVITSMKKVNREKYCHCELYDRPSPILMNQTISAPHIHSMALSILRPNLKQGSKVLDIGCGSGYMTACFAYLVNVQNYSTSHVVGIDIYKELVDFTIKNIKTANRNILPNNMGGLNKHKNVEIFTGNGWIGYNKYKYDVIHVGASATHIPYNLVKQLNIGGLLLIPIKNDYMLIQKIKTGQYQQRKITNVRFVPLILHRDTIKMT